MTKKIAIKSFWPDFNYEKNFIIDLFIEPNYIYTLDHLEADLIIFGSFINIDDTDNINQQQKKILYITEPLEKHYPITWNLLQSNYFDGVIGCVKENSELNYVRWPFYCLIFYLSFNSEEILNKTNKYVKNEDISQKKFCCLINSHDNGNTRVPIHKQLSKISDIDCPGKLLNNCSNEELNSIGNFEFIKKYLFNICPENYILQFEGYTTEKLFNCCLGGAIPIYQGYVDEVDKMIFNFKRIIVCNPNDDLSNTKTYNRVKRIFNNKEKLEKIYRKKVFKKNAYLIIKNLENNVKKMINKILL